METEQAPLTVRLREDALWLEGVAEGGDDMRIVAVLREAADAYERVSGMLEGYDTGDLRKVYLASAGPDYAKGGFEVVLCSPAGAALVEMFAELLRSENAPNFLAIEATHPELGQIEFTVQRVQGESTVAKLKRLTARIEELERQIPASTASQVE